VCESASFRVEKGRPTKQNTLSVFITDVGSSLDTIYSLRCMNKEMNTRLTLSFWLGQH
jgi:hypothetical protein